MWLHSDSGAFGVGDDGDGRLNWSQALAWAEGLEHAGYSDWRLPNAKELQSIVDYGRSPESSNSAAIDAVFEVSAISNEDGGADFPFYWSSTTHHTGPNIADAAAYLAFGRALGYMERPPNSGQYSLMDVHGAGAQRSDPKRGDPGDYPHGHGPQGDVIRIFNFVRPVRDIDP